MHKDIHDIVTLHFLGAPYQGAVCLHKSGKCDVEASLSITLKFALKNSF